MGLVARPRRGPSHYRVPPGEEIHVYSEDIVLAYVVLSSPLWNCRPFGIGVDLSKIMTDQIVDFASVEDLDNKRCMTGPLSDGYRSSHSSTRVGPRAWV